jgi:hypothetical protein
VRTRQADRDRIHSERIEKSHSRLGRAAKTETDKIFELLQSNTDLTEQDKELTEQVAHLTKQIHALLAKQNERQAVSATFAAFSDEPKWPASQLLARVIAS